MAEKEKITKEKENIIYPGDGFWKNEKRKPEADYNPTAYPIVKPIDKEDAIAVAEEIILQKPAG